MTNKIRTNGFARVQEDLPIPLATRRRPGYRVYVADEPKKPRPHHSSISPDDPALTASGLLRRDTTKSRLPGGKSQMVRPRGKAAAAVSSLFRGEDMRPVIHRGNPSSNKKQGP